ncbi:MAG: ATP-binding protein [Thermodesulfobacteriota bacterium]
MEKPAQPASKRSAAVIKSARIENFNGFPFLELPDLGRITLLGGRNNTGKTSVLEALFLFHDRLNPSLVHRQFGWQGVGVLPLEPEAIWGPIFRRYDLTRTISISITDETGTETMAVQCSRLLPTAAVRERRPGDSSDIPQLDTTQEQVPPVRLDLTYRREGRQDQILHLEMRPAGLGLHAEYAETGVRPTTYLAARSARHPSEDATRFGRLDVLGRQDTVVEFLRIMEPRLKSLSTVAAGEQSLVHGDIAIGRKIPVAFMGDGMARLLSLILAIATSEHGLVLVDEVENGIHHSVVDKVWEGVAAAARALDCQVIATPHSQECLAATVPGMAAAGMADEFRYVRLDRTGEDITAKTCLRPFLQELVL